VRRSPGLNLTNGQYCIYVPELNLSVKKTAIENQETFLDVFRCRVLNGSNQIRRVQLRSLKTRVSKAEFVVVIRVPQAWQPLAVVSIHSVRVAWDNKGTD
jgi:hypothetical protein